MTSYPETLTNPGHDILSCVFILRFCLVRNLTQPYVSSLSKSATDAGLSIAQLGSDLSLIQMRVLSTQSPRV